MSFQVNDRVMIVNLPDHTADERKHLISKAGRVTEVSPNSYNYIGIEMDEEIPPPFGGMQYFVASEITKI